MAQELELDLDALMAQLRENIRKRRKALGAAEYPQDERKGSDLATLHSHYDLACAPFSSHRRLLGRPIVALKEILRRLVVPILEPQVVYNGANARLITWLTSRTDEFQHNQARLPEEVISLLAPTIELIERRLLRELDQLSPEMAAFRRGLEALARRHDELSTAITATDSRRAELRELLESLMGQQIKGEGRVEALRERTAAVERKLRRMQHAPSADDLAAPTTNGHGAEARDPLSNGAGESFDYVAFEERFRGSQADISKRLAPYLECFPAGGVVVDLGCGRGEFLELMHAAEKTARGVDCNLDMVLLCREKGLDVTQMDLLEFLHSQLDGSLGGILCSQVLEHLATVQVQALIAVAHRKLAADGMMVLETLNPESLPVHLKWFWMDPTHVRLLHPETLRFMCESIGFREVRVRFAPEPEGTAESLALLQPDDGPLQLVQSLNRATGCLNTLLHTSAEYAVIAKK